MSEILSYPPPSRISRYIVQILAQLQSAAVAASAKISSFNLWAANKLKISIRWVRGLEIGGLVGLGFTSMQIGEWASAIACWVILGSVFFVKALAWKGFKSVKMPCGLERFLGTAGTVVVTVLLIMITTLRKPDSDHWSNLQKLSPQKSVLTMEAHLYMVSGPKRTTTQIRLNVNNAARDDIQHVNLTVTMRSNRTIYDISEISVDHACNKIGPVDIHPQITATFNGKDGSHVTIDMQDAANMRIETHGSPEWQIGCDRVSGQTLMTFQIEVPGDAENDAVQISGKYELIESKGSIVITVPQKAISLKK